MAAFVSHADQIVAAARDDVFGRDLDAADPTEIAVVLAAYASALRAIGAPIVKEVHDGTADDRR